MTDKLLSIEEALKERENPLLQIRHPKGGNVWKHRAPGSHGFPYWLAEDGTIRTVSLKEPVEFRLKPEPREDD